MNTMLDNWAKAMGQLEAVQTQSAIANSEQDENRRYEAGLACDAETDGLIAVLSFMKETGQLEVIGEYLDIVDGSVG
ncbi:MAG: hypothetical protein ABJO27_19250 [Pseudoruegeria sp.]